MLDANIRIRSLFTLKLRARQFLPSDEITRPFVEKDISPPRLEPLRNPFEWTREFPSFFLVSTFIISDQIIPSSMGLNVVADDHAVLPVNRGIGEDFPGISSRRLSSASRRRSRTFRDAVKLSFVDCVPRRRPFSRAPSRAGPSRGLSALLIESISAPCGGRSPFSERGAMRQSISAFFISHAPFLEALLFSQVFLSRESKVRFVLRLGSFRPHLGKAVADASKCS